MRLHKFKSGDAVIRCGDCQQGRILFRQFCVVVRHTGEYFFMHEDDIRSYARRMKITRENEHWQEYDDSYFVQPSYVVHWPESADVTSELEENLTNV